MPVKRVAIALALAAAVLFSSCSLFRGKSVPPGSIAPEVWFPTSVTREINKVLPSIVEVAAVLEYRVEEYIYELANGQYIPDPTSPVGYRLKGGNRKSGIVESKTNTKAFGAGLVIGKSESRNLILTSRHIVVQRDTITDYVYLNGRYTDIPRTRAFLTRNELGIRARSNVLRPAEILVTDPRMDLALITVSRSDFLGREYQGHILAHFEPVAGHYAVAVGYPDEMIQIAAGFTTEAPYPGNFSLGIHGDFGFSGGPIFLFEPGKGFFLIGIGKSMPGKRMFFVTPDSSLQFKTRLKEVDIPHLRIEEMPVLAPHRIFGVRVEYVLRFLRQNLALLERLGFHLPAPIFNAVRKVDPSSN